MLIQAKSIFFYSVSTNTMIPEPRGMSGAFYAVETEMKTYNTGIVYTYPFDLLHSHFHFSSFCCIVTNLFICLSIC